MANATFPIDTNRIRIVSGGHAEGLTQWDRSGEKARKTDKPELDPKTNLPLWDVKVSAVMPNAETGEDEMHEWTVRVPSAENPAQPVLTEVQLRDVIASVNWKGTVYFSAAGVVAKGADSK